MFEITDNRINLIVDEEPVGYILYDEKDSYIVGSYIYVKPDERGKGYSSLLLERFIDFLKEKGKPVMPTCPVIKRFVDSNFSELIK